MTVETNSKRNFLEKVRGRWPTTDATLRSERREIIVKERGGYNQFVFTEYMFDDPNIRAALDNVVRKWDTSTVESVFAHLCGTGIERLNNYVIVGSVRINARLGIERVQELISLATSGDIRGN